ncbi:MAG: transporter substrate-binding domain-containing protein [Desulfobacteraceae bacterium]|nr:transporter substrate-binding domain-containing protein [Desulfobacteraceae bacterium]
MKKLISGYKIFAFVCIFFSTANYCYCGDIVSFEYPPYLDFDNKGIFANINKEVNLISKEKFMLTPLPRIRAIQQFENDKSLIFVGEKRYFPGKDNYLTSCSIMKSELVLVYLRSRGNELGFSSLGDLKGKKAGVSLGSNLSDIFKNNGIIVEEWPMLEGNIRKLDSGRIDYWGTTDITASALINQYFKGRKNKFVIQKFSDPFVIEAVAWKGSPGEKKLEIYCRAIEELKNSGRLITIIDDFSYEELEK